MDIHYVNYTTTQYEPKTELHVDGPNFFSLVLVLFR